jgi:hypothetical protein
MLYHHLILLEEVIQPMNTRSMTKEEALRWKENWKVVNQFILEEKRRRTPEERLADFDLLFDFGQWVGWKGRDSGLEAVRDRWVLLKKRLGVC